MVGIGKGIGGVRKIVVVVFLEAGRTLGEGAASHSSNVVAEGTKDT